MERRYDFEGEVFVDEGLLKTIAVEFLAEEGAGKDWNDINNFLWDWYSGYVDWDRVMDDITDDVFELYKELAEEEKSEEE